VPVPYAGDSAHASPRPEAEKAGELREEPEKVREKAGELREEPEKVREKRREPPLHLALV